MNIAVPTRSVATGTHTASGSSTDTCSLTAYSVPSTSEHRETISGTITGMIMQYRSMWSTGSTSVTAIGPLNGAPFSFTISCTNAVAVIGAPSLSATSNVGQVTLSGTSASVVNKSAIMVSGHISSSHAGRMNVQVSGGVTYNMSTGYSGSKGGSYNYSSVSNPTFSSVTTNSGYGSATGGSAAWSVSISGASSSSATYSFSVNYTVSSSYTRYQGSGSVYVPSSASSFRFTSNKGGSFSYRKNGTTLSYSLNNVTSSGTAHVTVSYSYPVTDYTTYADARFTGQYANGASAVNAQVNYIYFNGERYP